MKKFLFFIVILFTVVYCTNNEIKNVENDDIKNTNEKIEIVTSIIPLASISNYIGWDFVDAKSLIPAWVSAHGFDLKPNQLIDIAKSDLIVYLWLEHIDWFLSKAIEWKNVAIVSDWIELINLEEKHEHEQEYEDEHHEEENEDKVHEYDPHIWTSSVNALIIATKIKEKLIELSPENKSYFEANYTNFESDLRKVKQQFSNNIWWKDVKEFIVFHDAYNYLFDELLIDTTKKLVFQKSVLNDPKSSEMKELIDEIKLHQVKVAFKEPQLNDSNLQKLSLDYGLNINTIDPLWKDESKNWYIENYKSNLQSLEKIYE